MPYPTQPTAGAGTPRPRWRWGAAALAATLATLAATAVAAEPASAVAAHVHAHGPGRGGHAHAAPGLDSAQAQDPRVERMRRDPRRLGLLDAGEAALRRGDSAAALEAFEGASSLMHAADSELGLVRAALQAGRYREAMAFCAHTADAHPESFAAAALYGVLLAAGGQPEAARKALGRVRELAPGDAVLKQAQALVEAGFGVPAPALLQPPHRMAPHPVMEGGQAAPPAAAAVRGGAVLLADGRHALAPLKLVQGAGALWVRNGLGRTVAARVERRDVAGGVAMLALAPGLDAGGLEYAAGSPRAGRPGFAVAQAPQAASALPAWPWLFRGFVGRVAARDGSQELGIDVPPAADGVLLMDAEGRVAGMGVRGAQGGLRVVPVAGFAGRSLSVADAVQGGVLPATQPGPAMDEVYERSLRIGLQLIAAR